MDSSVEECGQTQTISDPLQTPSGLLSAVGADQESRTDNVTGGLREECLSTNDRSLITSQATDPDHGTALCTERDSLCRFTSVSSGLSPSRGQNLNVGAGTQDSPAADYGLTSSAKLSAWRAGYSRRMTSSVPIPKEGTGT